MSCMQLAERAKKIPVCACRCAASARCSASPHTIALRVGRFLERQRLPEAATYRIAVGPHAGRGRRRLFAVYCHVRNATSGLAANLADYNDRAEEPRRRSVLTIHLSADSKRRPDPE